ncbi:hypothetical protein ACFX2I_025911 [Malus domestica]
MSSKTHHCKTINCKTQELGFPTARILSASRSSVQSSSSEDAVAQVLHDQEEAGEEDEAEPTHSSLDPHEDRQHHQALAPHQAWILRWITRYSISMCWSRF